MSGPYSTAKLLLDSNGAPVIMSGSDKDEDIALVSAKANPLTGGSDLIINGADGLETFAVSVNLRRFGAIGDGVTDDYAAIMRAYDALPATGGCINVGKGSFLHKTAIVLSKPVCIKGEGCGTSAGAAPSSLIKHSSISGAGITLLSAGVSLEGFSYTCQPGNIGDGILLSAGRQRLKDLGVYGAGNDNIRVGTTAGVNANLWRMDNIYSKGATRHGIYISDKTAPTGADANGGTLTHADLQSNGGDGLAIGNAQLNNFYNIVAQTNAGNGISISGSGGENNTFFGLDSESNTGAEILVSAGAVNNTFFGGSILGTVTDSGTSTIMLGVRGAANSTGLRLGNVANTDTKTLDWYEEGTFTPVLSFSAPGDLNVAYGAGGQIGKFTRIGNRVFVDITLETTTFTHTTASGPISITGLPYAAGGIAGQVMRGSCMYQGYSGAANPHLVPQIGAGASVIQLRASGPGVSVINPGVTNFTSGSAVVMDLSIVYQVP